METLVSSPKSFDNAIPKKNDLIKNQVFGCGLITD